MANARQKVLRKLISKAIKKGGSIPGHKIKTNIGDPLKR